ncbi:MAG: DUF4825 domain-containing protein [Bacilli bacterium]|nr:DUF4825 domain-containing protein [Bacilli bacterium]
MKKKTIMTIVVVLILILLIPIPMKLWDGGSIEYKALLYKITKYHKLNSVSRYDEGWKIEILGIKIYDKINSKEYTTQAQYLFDLKNKYIGDNSADIKLLEALEVSKLANYTIELKISEKPYVLYINFEAIDPTNVTNDILSNFKRKMKQNSIILLALIENVDEIHYNDRFCDCVDNIVKLKASDLEKEYSNIKDYSKTVEKFQELLDKIEYNK